MKNLLIVFTLILATSALANAAASSCSEYLRRLGGPDLTWTGRSYWQIENIEEEVNTLGELSGALSEFKDGESLEIGLYTAETRTKNASTEIKKNVIRKFVERGIYLSRHLPYFEGQEYDIDGPNGILTFSQRSYRYAIWVQVNSREEALALRSFLASPDQRFLQYSFTFAHPKAFDLSQYAVVRERMELTHFSNGEKLELLFVPQVGSRGELLGHLNSFGVSFSPVETDYPLSLKAYSDGIKLTVENETQLKKIEAFLVSESKSLKFVVFPETIHRQKDL